MQSSNLQIIPPAFSIGPEPHPYIKPIDHGPLEVLDNDAGITYTKVEVEYSAICSYGKAPFNGVITVEYKPTYKILEFSSLDDFIHSFANENLLIEDVTRLVTDKVRRVTGDIPIRVTVTARTTVHSPVITQIEQGDWK